jgi:hypothetical protein
MSGEVLTEAGLMGFDGFINSTGKALACWINIEFSGIEKMPNNRIPHNPNASNASDQPMVLFFVKLTVILLLSTVKEDFIFDESQLASIPNYIRRTQ